MTVELGEDGKPKYRGSGKDLSYRDEVNNEKFIPHVIEPSAGADRGASWLSCAKPYCEDEAPDDKRQAANANRL